MWGHVETGAEPPGGCPRPGKDCASLSTPAPGMLGLCAATLLPAPITDSRCWFSSQLLSEMNEAGRWNAARHGTLATSTDADIQLSRF